MGAVEAHLLFVAVSGATLIFTLLMRYRLRTGYPDDTSKQMQSMLGFLRGMAMFAGLVLVVALVDLVRVLVT